MDTFARGLKAAAKIKTDGTLDKWVAARYSSFDSGIGAKIEVRVSVCSVLSMQQVDYLELRLSRCC